MNIDWNFAADGPFIYSTVDHIVNIRDLNGNVYKLSGAQELQISIDQKGDIHLIDYGGNSVPILIRDVHVAKVANIKRRIETMDAQDPITKLVKKEMEKIFYEENI